MKKKGRVKKRGRVRRWRMVRRAGESVDEAETSDVVRMVRW